MNTNTHTNWFESWFDTPYYHILYKNRDYTEAEFFIDNLIKCLQPKPNERFLDLGCGKGRHSVFLNSKKFDVTGIDLSPQNIDCAKQFENDTLKFYVHDMRKVFRENYFNCVFNLFTSFGYFENDDDNFSTIDAVSRALLPNGIFVIDFFNVEKVFSCLPYKETKTVDDIKFRIEKKTENNFIVKNISFQDKGKNYTFQERVKAISLKDFERYLKNSGLEIKDVKGNYKLKNFNKHTSDRLIIIAQKNK